MPREVRYVLFSEEELYRALINDLRERHLPMPHGFLTRIVLGKGAPIDVTVICATDEGVEIPTRFESEDVLRSLILYCAERSIPMSKKAVKTLEIKGGMLTLVCTLGLQSPGTATSTGTKPTGNMP